MLYPDIFWGAISSSGVTEAIYDYWQYWEPIRLYGPQDCVNVTQQFVQVIDGIIIDQKDNATLVAKLKNAFGLGNITYSNDFASTLATYGLGGWQGRNWDPAVGDTSFSGYCGRVTSTSVIYPESSGFADTARDLIAASGRIQSPSESFVNQTINFIGWAYENLFGTCAGRSSTQDECYGSHNKTSYHLDDYSQKTWRSWAWQYCTQWGYYPTGSGVPADIFPLLSRTIDLNYMTIVCRAAFNISSVPDLQSINQYGGFGIAADRLAFIDGQVDAWKYATPHAPSAPKRNDTLDRPYYTIPDAGHHWDENGLFPNETTANLPPKAIIDVQAYEVRFVKQWLYEYSRLQ